MSASADWTSTLEFYLNGDKIVVGDVDPGMSLLEFIRTKTAYTGTKSSCNQGGCGACTVLLTEYDETTKDFKHRSCNACLRPVASMDGCAITTTEGLGNNRTGIHPVQERIAGNGGSQCGFCTPGMVMSTYAALKESGGKATIEDMEAHLDGNLCRCTGYRPILGAVQTFGCGSCATQEKCGGGGEDSSKGACGLPPDVEDLCNKFSKYDVENDPAPPAELKARVARPLKFIRNGNTYYRPVTLQQVRELKKEFGGTEGGVRLVCGNTSTGVFPEQKEKVLVDVKGVPALHVVSDSPACLTVGAAVPISALIKLLQEGAAASPTYANMVDHLKKMANTHVRNVGSWTGNLWMAKTKGFGSDLATVMMGAGARVSYVEATADAAAAAVSCDVATFLSDAVSADVVVTAISIPKSAPGEHFRSFRTAARAVNAHAYVNAAFRATLDEQKQIRKPCIGFGVVGFHPVRATATEAFLEGKAVTQETLDGAMAVLKEEVQVEEEKLFCSKQNPEGKQAFRSALPCTYLYKFFMHLAFVTGSLSSSLNNSVTPTSAPRPISSSTQVFDTAEGRQAMPSISATAQACGEAEYTDDTPNTVDGLFSAFVLSTVALGSIEEVDAADALAAPGVVDYVTAADIPGANNASFVPGEEPLFATKATGVIYYGQPLGLIVAKSYREARAAAKLVKVTYGAAAGGAKPILSLEEAIEAESFMAHAGDMGTMVCGDVEKGFEASARVIEGEYKFGEQNAFYMEKMAAVAMPGEMQHMTVHASCQAPNFARAMLSAVLGVDGSKVTVRQRRAGGGFGPKNSQGITTYAAAAVAAHKLRRPVRLVLDISADMQHVGGRHAQLVKYKAGMDAEGKLTALEVKAYSNGGCSTDFTGFLTGEFARAINSVYLLPNCKVSSYACKLNVASRTAVRAFGHPQANFLIETVLSDVAAELQLGVHDVRLKNMFNKNNCVTVYGQMLEHYNLPEIWAKLEASAEYEARQQAVKEFNANNAWVKRGLCMSPVAYGHNYIYNSGTGALVNVNSGDGSVVVHHGGTEIGQGIHTKVAQAVALTLGCPLDKVHVADTNTDVVPNMAFTGGSITSECNVEAARRACEELKTRMWPFKEALWRAEGKEPSWEAVCAAANHFTGPQTSLSATGCFAAVGKGADDGLGNRDSAKFAEDYYTFGAAVSEVEVDLLTGEKTVVRADILFDVGTSINPTVDVGQIEGAFAFGIGLHCTEEFLTQEDGKEAADGTWEYKPPCYTDVPLDMRVELLRDHPYQKGVLRSKAVGEPPLLLSYSVFGAIREALKDSRHERGLPTRFRMDGPASVDRIRTVAGIANSDLRL